VARWPIPGSLLYLCFTNEVVLFWGEKNPLNGRFWWLYCTEVVLSDAIKPTSVKFCWLSVQGFRRSGWSILHCVWFCCHFFAFFGTPTDRCGGRITTISPWSVAQPREGAGARPPLNPIRIYLHIMKRALTTVKVKNSTVFKTQQRTKNQMRSDGRKEEDKCIQACRGGQLYV